MRAVRRLTAVAVLTISVAVTTDRADSRIGECVSAVAAPGCAVRASVRLAADDTGWSAADIRAAYGLRADAPGQRVYVVGLGNAPTLDDDLAAYRSDNALPPCDLADRCLQVTDDNGTDLLLFPGATPPMYEDQGYSDTTVAAAEMVSAVCPLCDITVVLSSTASRLVDAFDTVRAFGGRVLVSTYGLQPASASEIRRYDAFDFDRTVYTASSGSDGYVNGTPVWPRSSPAVVSVGSTALARTDDGFWLETGLKTSGSQCLASVPKPPWQASVPRDVCTGRATSDIAAVSTGVSVVIGGRRFRWLAGGVSPAVVGALAATRLRPRSDENPAAYLWARGTAPTASSVIDDVNTGADNGTCGAPLCRPGDGWDGPTGLGTPRGSDALAPPVGEPLPGRAGKVTFTSSDPGIFQGKPRCLGVQTQDDPMSYLNSALEVTLGPCDDPHRLLEWKVLRTRAFRRPTRTYYSLALDVPGAAELPCLNWVGRYDPVLTRLVPAMMRCGSGLEWLARTTGTALRLRSGWFVTPLPVPGTGTYQHISTTEASDRDAPPASVRGWQLPPT